MDDLDWSQILTKWERKWYPDLPEAESLEGWDEWRKKCKIEGFDDDGDIIKDN
jgi:hypothetical protein